MNITYRYLSIKFKPRDDVFLIRYEELFEDNFKNIRNIFDKIGLQYTDDIFKNELYNNKYVTGLEKPKEQVSNQQHELYRTYQINQPIVNKNDDSKLCLTPEEMSILKNNPIIRQLYPEL
jgi:hypothetical protein